MYNFFYRDNFFRDFLSNSNTLDKEKVFYEILNLKSKFININILLELKEIYKLQKKNKFLWLSSDSFNKNIISVKDYFIMKRIFSKKNFIYFIKYFIREFNYIKKILDIRDLGIYEYLKDLNTFKHNIIFKSLLGSILSLNNILYKTFYDKFFLIYKINFYIIEIIKNKFNISLNLVTSLTKYKNINSAFNSILPNNIFDKNYNIIIFNRIISFIEKISKTNYFLKKKYVIPFKLDTSINYKVKLKCIKLKYINNYFCGIIINMFKVRFFYIKNFLLNYYLFCFLFLYSVNPRIYWLKVEAKYFSKNLLINNLTLFCKINLLNLKLLNKTKFELLNKRKFKLLNKKKLY